jgi:transcription elongation GreA/GreB family factor
MQSALEFAEDSVRIMGSPIPEEDFVDKRQLIAAICKKLESDLEGLKAAARAAYDAATNEESKPENEYDTRGLEASYLAGAQAKRVAEIEQQVAVYKHVEVKDYTAQDKIGATALVEVEFDGRRSHVLVMGQGGGLTFHFENQAIQVVTPSSPLGEALLGLKVGDVAIVDVADDELEYEIVGVQ